MLASSAQVYGPRQRISTETSQHRTSQGMSPQSSSTGWNPCIQLIGACHLLEDNIVEQVFTTS